MLDAGVRWLSCMMCGREKEQGALYAEPCTDSPRWAHIHRTAGHPHPGLDYSSFWPQRETHTERNQDRKKERGDETITLIAGHKQFSAGNWFRYVEISDASFEILRIRRIDWCSSRRSGGMQLLAFKWHILPLNDCEVARY